MADTCRDPMAKWSFCVAPRLHLSHSYFSHHPADVVPICRALPTHAVAVLKHQAEALDVAYSMELAVRVQPASVERAFAVKVVANLVVAIFGQNRIHYCLRQFER